MTGKVMPHSTVGLDPSGNYVVLVEGDPVPEWFTLDGAKPDSDGEGEDSKPPPKSGPKGSAKAWADYAAALHIDVPPNAKAGEIIASLDAAGVPTE